MPFDKSITDGSTHCGREVFWFLRDNGEGNGDSYLGLVEICDVINKRTFVPNMNETKTRRTAKSDNDSVRKAIKAGMSGRERLVDWISSGKILGIIGTPSPSLPGLSRSFAICLTNTRALTTAQLLESKMRDVFFREPQLIHPAHDIYVLADITNTLGLTNKKPRTGGEGTTMGVVTDAVLTNPNSTNATIAHELHGAVGNTRTRAKEEDGDGGGGDVDDAFVVGDGDGAVLAAEGTVLQIEEGHAVLDLRESLQVRALDAWGLGRHLRGPA